MNKEEERYYEIGKASYEWVGERGNTEFRWGAEWADKHPRKGLVDIEKVYNIIKDLYAESGIEYAEMLIQIIRQKLEE